MTTRAAVNVALSLLLLSTVPETTTSTAQVVELSPEQFQALGEQINGAAYGVMGFLAIVVLCLGAMVFIQAVGGR